MSIEVVGKHLVDLTTGEIINPVYEVVKTQASTDDKRYYSATARSPEECTDPEQLADFVSAVCDMRGIKLKTELVWFKKESDYAVRTLKEKALISNKQFEVLSSVVGCIAYKNIVLCKRSVLCKALGCEDKHLARKLASIEQWCEVRSDVKKGYVKVIITPFLAYKGRDYSKDSSFKTYYTADAETKYNALYVPFVGPVKPYTAPKWSKEMQSYLDNLNTNVAKRWETKDSIQHVGTEFFVEKEEETPSWVLEELPEFDYSCVQYEESCNYF